MTIKGRTYTNKMRYIISIIQRIKCLLLLFKTNNKKKNNDRDKKLSCFLLTPKNIHKQIIYLFTQSNDCTRKDTNQSFIRNDDEDNNKQHTQQYLIVNKSPHKP